MYVYVCVYMYIHMYIEDLISHLLTSTQLAEESTALTILPIRTKD